jgi:cysteine desulfurase
MLMSNRIYLDHAATTPVVPAAREAMATALANWANPSSPHGDGRKAKAALEDARAQVRAALDWDGEVIFTSGASEAISMALAGFDAVASAVEHDAVLNAVGAEARLPVDAGGIVQLGSVAKGRRYAIQQVNNETGVIQPLADLSDAIRNGGGLLFADCSQGAGKLALPDADMIALSGHKFGGPPGIGALLLRDLALLRPTGGQEQGYRRGTENLPSIMGLAAALEAGFGWLAEAARLRVKLDSAIKAHGGMVIANESPRLATIASYRMPGVSASSQLIGFDMAGISVSAGSACSSGTLKTSHVLGAMGWDAAAAGEVVRVSFGPQTSEADIDRFIAQWTAMKNRAAAA